MTPQEVVEVVGVLTVAFGRKATPEMFEVFGVALEDLEVSEPRQVVLGLVRTMEEWPSPARLRRVLLDRSGLLPPDEDQAWDLVRRTMQPMGSMLYLGTTELPAVVQEAVRTMGGSRSMAMGVETTIRAQFRDAYRLARKRAVDEALGASWKGVVISGGGRVELHHGRRGLDRGSEG